MNIMRFFVATLFILGTLFFVFYTLFISQTQTFLVDTNQPLVVPSDNSLAPPIRQPFTKLLPLPSSSPTIPPPGFQGPPAGQKPFVTGPSSNPPR
jgi:hypothetical protein